MARSWLIPHWRRIVMQGTLWLVFAASIGVAVLVAYEKRRALRVALRDRETIGRLHVSLPKTWSAASKAQESVEPGDSIYVEEQPAGNIAAGRHLAIRRVRTGSFHDGLLSPIEYLFRIELLSERDLPPAAAHGESAVVQPIEIAGWPGKLITQTVVSNSPRAPVKKSLLACATLPNSQALLIRLTGDGPPDAADEELVRQMAETITVTDIAPAEKNTGTVSLTGGMSVDAPPGFSLVPTRDPNRTCREIVTSTSGDPWTAVEIIPCTWFTGDGEEAFLSLLAVRDRTWKPGPVTQAGPNLWFTDRSDNKIFPSRAYLQSNGVDQALLVILRGSYRDAGGIDPAWQAIARSIHFAPQRDLTPRLEAGAQAVRQVQEQGIDPNVTPLADLQSWLLWDQAENLDQRLWMQVRWNLQIAAKTNPDTGAIEEPAVWNGKRQTLPPDLFGSAPEWQVEWAGTSDLQTYSARSSATGNRRGPAGAIAVQNGYIEATPDRLKLSLRESGDLPRPPQYIPGGWLPMLLWSITREGKPMILRTESFVGYDGLPLRSLLTLLVQRVTTDGQDSISVQVNGSGQTTRWYYHPGKSDEESTLRYIDLTNDLRAQRSDKVPPRIND